MEVQELVLSAQQKRQHVIERTFGNCRNEFGFTISEPIDEHLFAEVLQAITLEQEMLQSVTYHHEELLFPVHHIGAHNHQNFTYAILQDALLNDFDAAATYIDEFFHKTKHSNDTMSFLFKVSDEKFLFVVSSPKYAMDFPSVKLFVQRLFDKYSERKNERSVAALDVLPYSRYSNWQHSLYASAKEDNVTHWEQFDKVDFSEDRLTFHGEEFSRSSVSSFDVNIQSLKADLLLTAKTLGVSLKDLLFSAWGVLFFRYTGKENFRLGVVSHDRQHDVLSRTVGLFSKVLPINIETTARTTMRDFVQSLYNARVEAEDWQDYFLMDREGLLDQQDPAYVPYTFDYLDHLEETIDWTISLDHLQYYFDKFNVQLSVLDFSDRLVLRFQFPDAFSPREAVERYANSFKCLLQGIVQSPDLMIADYAIVSDIKENAIAATVIPVSKQRDITMAFREQVAVNRNSKAVIFHDRVLTYQELDQWTEAVAHTLRNDFGIEEGDVVAMLLERSELMIVGILGILKAGAAYLPVDSNYPVERIRTIFTTSESKLLLSDVVNFSRCADIMPSACIQDFNRVPSEKILHQPKDTDLAYIIYTSGSTGTPKGVTITHASVVNLAAALQTEIFEDSALLNLSLLASCAFDASVQQIFGALLNGHSLTIIDLGTSRNGRLLLAEIYKMRISALDITPALFSILLDERFDAKQSILKYVLVGGEAFTSKLLIKVFTSKLIETASVVNVYGPTECCVDATYYKLSFADEGSHSVPIGKPLRGYNVYVLNESLQSAPHDAIGEIFVGGVGLSPGYINDGTLTSQAFLTHPVTGERIYKTGDLAFIKSDGNIVYVRRRDSQIKLRGFRIELGEVEKALLRYPDFEGAFVLAKTDNAGTNELVSFVKCIDDKTFEGDNIKNFLQAWLPSYMIPSRIRSIDRFPLTTNGKVDARALIALEDQMLSKRSVVLPATLLEEKLVGIWKTILQKVEIGVNENFFDLGGHSLKAIQIVSSVYKELEYEIELKNIFEFPNVRALAAFIETLSTIKFAPITPVPKADHYELSHAQKRLWILDHLEEDQIAYNVPSVLHIKGDLSVDAFVKAYNAIIARHESLRTTFIEVDGEPRQRIHEQTTAEIEISDLTEKTSHDQIKNAIHQEATTPFDLEKGPLVRARLLKLDVNEFLFLFTIHHILSDGWSMEVFAQEFFAFYDAFKTDRELEMQPLSIQYKDYAAWQNARLSGDEILTSERYWLGEFRDSIPVLQLPLDFSRPAIKRYNGDVVTFTLNKAITNNLTEIGNKHNTTLFMTLLASLNALLYKYSGQTDIVVGVPVAGRHHNDLENQIGFFVNTLPLRCTFGENLSFSHLLNVVREKTLSGFNHQLYPFDLLVQNLSLAKDMSRSPLFDVMLVLQHTNMRSEMSLTDNIGLSFEEYPTRHYSSKFDLLFNIQELDGEMLVFIEYNTDLFRRDTIERMSLHYQTLISSLASQPECALCDLSYLTSAEIQELVYDFNNTEIPEFFNKGSVVDWFEQQVKIKPTAVALRSSTEIYLYGEMSAKVNRLAHYLIRTHRVTSNDKVAMMMPRSCEGIVTIMAIMKTGAAYVPIEYDQPLSRIEYILSDVQPKVVISNSIVIESLSLQFDKLVAIDMIDFTSYQETDPRVPIKLSDVSFIIYTSGSTGNPKGVIQTHQTLANLIQWDLTSSGLEFECTTLQYASFAFDAVLNDMFFALCSGGSLFVTQDNERYDFAILKSLIIAHKIQIVSLPFSVLSNFFGTFTNEELVGHAIRHIISTGEQLLIGANLKNFLLANPHVVLHNFYGPTETHVVTAYRMNGHGEIQKRPSIGRPIANSGIYILDHKHQPVAIGIQGEVYIGGANLAYGYLNLDALTSDRFISVMLAGKEVNVYKSGDICKWLPNGMIEYIGRRDHQLKIRGNRIELKEIEKAVLSYPGIEKTAIIPKDDKQGNMYLIAYFSSSSRIEAQEMEAYLRTQLPSYMVPSFVISLETLPLTLNGKVDKSRLPEPETASADGHIGRAPQNTVEMLLCELFSSLLEKDDIAVDDSFFALGGHSLKGIRLISEIHKRFDVRVEFRTLFQSDTPELLARVINSKVVEKYFRIQPLSAQSSYAVSLFQRRLWILSQLDESAVAYNIPMSFRIKGPLNVQAFERTIRQLLNRHEALRTAFTLDGDELKQVVRELDNDAVVVEYIDLTNDIDRDIRAEEIVEGEALYAFDLETGPLLRVKLLALNHTSYIVVVNIHHIIFDAWSKDILMNEFVALYTSNALNTPSILPVVSIHYKDYAAWQLAQLNDLVISEQKTFWIRKFATPVAPLALRTDFPRPSVKTYNGSTQTIHLGDNRRVAVDEFSSRQGVTPFMTMFSALAALLYRYTGQTDLVIGTNVSGRTHADLQNVIGFFINTLPVRISFAAEDQFTELLQQVKSEVLQSFEHQLIPFDRIVEEVKPANDLSRSPLFDVMIEYRSEDQLAKTFNLGSGLDIQEFDFESTISKFDLTFIITEVERGLDVTCEYNTDLFKRETIDHLLARFTLIVDSFTAEPSLDVADLNVMSPEEKHFLLDRKAGSRMSQTNFLDAFRAQVLKMSANAAISLGDSIMTYHELDLLSGQLAAYIVQTFDPRPDDLLGVMMRNSVDAIVSLLAILKSGAAFVPIDPQYPHARIEHILSDSRVRGVIKDDSNVQLPEIYPVVLYHAVDLKNVDPRQDRANVSMSDLAYVIYTSGSTGLPKGVAIEMHSFMNYLTWANQYYFNDETGYDFAFFSSLSFDLTLTSIFTTLLRGDKIVVYDEPYATEALRKIFEVDNKCRVVKLTPSHISILQHLPISSTNIRAVIAGGEALLEDHVRILRALNPEIVIYNEYGPTEATVGCTVKRVADGDGITSIGNAIANTSIYILDEQRRIQPLGIEGELFIAGEGLAREYVYRNELTAAKFLTLAFPDGRSVRVYRSGDRARKLFNGEIEYLGRIDEQIKIRGYRIEPGEIENCMLTHTDVLEATVTDCSWDSSDRFLVGYYVSNVFIEPPDWRKHLKASLPDYMVPQYFVKLDYMPINSNGKLDRDKLPLPSNTTTAETREMVLPENGVQKALLNIWKEVLGVEEISITDNFFEQGGHSLKATRILSVVHKTLNVKISLAAVYNHPTIKDLSVVLAKAVREQYKEIVPVAERQYYDVSFAQKRLWILDKFSESKTTYNIPGTYTFRGKLDLKALERAFLTLIERHEILRTNFVAVDDEPKQLIHPAVHPKFKVEYEICESENFHQETVHRIFNNERNYLFNLTSDSLLRLHVIQFADQRFVVVLNMHHIISDGWSMETLYNDLLQLYVACCHGEPNPLRPLRIQYKDFAHWQNSVINEHDETYWVNKIQGSPGKINLPYDFSNTGVEKFNGTSIVFHVGAETTGRLRAIAISNNTTLSNVVLTIFKILLYNISNQNDLCVGVAIATRNHVDLEPLIGFFVNTLLIRVNINGDEEFETLLKNVTETTTEAYEHQNYPFDLLVEKLRPDRVANQQPLFNVMYSFQNYRDAAVRKSDKMSLKEGTYDVQFMDMPIDRAFFDLSHRIFDNGSHLEMHFEYNTMRFTESTMQSIVESYHEFISFSVQDQIHAPA